MDTFDGMADESKPGFLRRCFPILGWLAPCNRNWPTGRGGAGLSVWTLPPPASDLHRCQLCYDDSVVPVEAEPLDLGLWDMRLRCGQCGTYRDVIVSDDAAQRYDKELNHGMAQIAAALERAEREHMRAEVRIFITALERDLIDAGDFAGG